jgi:hypothetical protein
LFRRKLKPPVDADPALLREFDQKPFWTENNFGEQNFSHK